MSDQISNVSSQKSELKGHSSLLRQFFLRFSGFPLSTETTTTKFQFNLETMGKDPVNAPLLNPIYLFSISLCFYEVKAPEILWVVDS